MNECSICFDTISTDKLTVACGHVFHACCMKKWKQTKNSCPLCRKDLDIGEDMFDMQSLPDDDYDKLVNFFGLGLKLCLSSV